ncbi:MAG: PAS domain S-box protein, partial [Rhodospirillales bacterium]|nr:PAS domain S-box protein [Rhodospirillales bacterium]
MAKKLPLEGGATIDAPDESGSVVSGFLGADLSELSTDQLRQLADAVHHGPSSIVITDTNAIISYVNPAFSQNTGYTFEESIGKRTSLLKSGHTQQRVYEEMWATITSGEVWRGELLNRRKDGTLYWEFAAIAPGRNAAGKIDHFIAVKEDVTKRYQAEQTVKDREKRFRDFAEAASEWFWETD